MAKPKKRIQVETVFGSQQEQDDYDVFAEPLIKKKTKTITQTVETTDQAKNISDQPNNIKCPIPKLNVQKLFHDILYDSSKSMMTMKILKQILSQGHRELQDKKKYFTFKWAQLQNMNCSRQEYMRQETELRALQARDTQEVYQQVIQALSENKIQGFKSKDEMLLEFRQGYLDQRMKSQLGPTVEEHHFYVDQNEAAQLKKSDQIALLEKLLQETQLTESVVNGDQRNIFKSSRPRADGSKYQYEVDIRNENEPQQPAFTLSDKIAVPKIIHEQLRNFNQQKIEDMLKLDKSEYQIMKRCVRVMLLDSKSDELYTVPIFQQKMNDKYVNLFQEIKNELPSDSRKITEQQLDKLLEITTYLVNNHHYQQKYKQPASSLMPKDVIALLDRIQKIH